MLFDDIISQIDDNSNVLTYQCDLYPLFSQNRGESPWAFINNPKKGKTAISDMVKVLDPDRVVKSLSVAQLLDIVNDIARGSDETVVIWIDNFERCNKRTLEYYSDLAAMANVFLVCNIASDEEEFINPQFFDDYPFVILNSDEFKASRSRSVNVKFTLLLFLSLFTFLLFVRIQLSLVGYLVSALWFSMLMYRSFYYVTR